MKWISLENGSEFIAVAKGNKLSILGQRLTNNNLTDFNFEWYLFLFYHT
jgi:hypothetical protein